jgi:hypothetical protein
VKVTVAKEGMKPVRAGSILMVLGLDVRGSEKVVLCADGNGAELPLTSWLTWSRDLDALDHDGKPQRSFARQDEPRRAMASAGGRR